MTGDETALATRAQAGETRAREELIERLLSSVVAAARAYRTEGLDFEDLVQERCVGVLRALERFEPERGTPFGAYAAWCVRQGLQELRSDFTRPLRLPRRALRQLAQLKSEHRRVYGEERHELSIDELAARTGIERGQVDALMRADARTRLLSEPVEGTEGEVGILGDLLEDPVSAAAYEEVLDSTGQQVRAVLRRLSERERDVVDARLGLDGQASQTLAEIGDRLGLSAERVRQIEERALAKLRRGR